MAVRLAIRVTMAFLSAVFAGCAETSVSTTDLSEEILQRNHFSLLDKLILERDDLAKL